MKLRAGAPWGTLAALTVAVAAAHWLALRPAPWTVQPQQRGPVAVFLIRPVAPAAIAPTADVRAAMPRPAATARSSSTLAPGTKAGGLDERAPPASAEPPSATDAAPPIPTVPRPAAEVPASARWRYQVDALRRGREVAGTADLAWRHDGQAYEAALHVRLPGEPERIQRSTGSVAADGLQPRRFGARHRSEEAAHFDPERGRIVFSTNRPPVPLRAGAQDRLSVLLQLGALVRSNAALLAPGTRIELQTAGTREADDWTFEVGGEEDLALPGGTVRARKLTRAPQREYDIRLELWLAPGAADGPVRLRLTLPHGDWLDMQWSGTDKG